jgi:chemotaxis protein methyltransferase CheR
MFTVSIPEVQTLIRAIKKVNGTDLSGLAMASFRYRISGILHSFKLDNMNSLIAKIQNDPKFTDIFISEISVGSPDMFRDPDLWIHIRENLLPIIFASRRYPEVVIPQCVTGDELYTLAIFLKETGLDYRVDLVASCRDHRIREQILKGELPNPRYKNSKDNFEVYNPDLSFEEYTETRQGKKYIKQELLERIEINVQKNDEPFCSDNTALVLYRNRMLYQNAEMQYRTLHKLLAEMKKGTCFIIGIGESIEGFGLEQFYRDLSSDYKIYIKNDGN